MRLSIANCLTALRILLGAALLLSILREHDRAALIFLLAAAVTELDGTVARATSTATEFGEQFDSAADAIFIGCGLLGLVVIGKLTIIEVGVMAACLAMEPLAKLPSLQSHFVAALPRRQWQKMTGVLPGFLLLLAILNVPGLRAWVWVVIALSAVRAALKVTVFALARRRAGEESVAQRNQV